MPPTGFAYPSSSFGYYKGSPLWQGQGSGAGMPKQGLGVLSQGVGPQGESGWHPTILYLLVFVVAEMIAFGLLARVLR